MRLTTRASGKDGGRQLVVLVGVYAGMLSLPLTNRALALAALFASALIASAAAARRRLPATSHLGGV